MRDIVRALVTAVMLGLPWWPALVTAQAVSETLQADFDRFLEWFPGEYDNHEQHWQDKLDKAPQVHERIHHIFYPVSAPAIGEHTYFVQQYMDGDPANIYRQRLYRFSVDATEGAIRLDIYSFNDEPKYRDAHLNPGILAGLGSSELGDRPGCEVYWKYTGEYFHGYMKEKACTVISNRTGQRIFITDDLRLTPDEIWIRDEAFFEDGSRVFGNAAGIHHKNRKVSFYSGWGGVSSDGPGMVLKAANWKEQDDGWEFIGELDNFGRFIIHNEGQIVPIPRVDGTPSGYSVQLAQLTQQSAQVPVLTYKIIEDISGKTIAYAWANPEAERIGVNVRWAQSGLTKQPDLRFGFEAQ